MIRNVYHAFYFALCGNCNEMKWDRTEEEFDHIIKIIQHRPELVERAGVQVSSSLKKFMAVNAMKVLKVP